jgi:RNA polymerase sigma factor (sigma-70 family)
MTTGYSYNEVITELKCEKNYEKYRVLTLDEEQVMIKQYADDPEMLKSKLIDHNMTLVTPFIQHYRTQLDADDIFQEGIAGLIDAVDRFDVNANVKFATYAYFYVKKYVTRLYKKNNRQFDGMTNGMVTSIHDTRKDLENDNIDCGDRLMSFRMEPDELSPAEHMCAKSDVNFVENLINNMLVNGIITYKETYVMDGIYYKNHTKREIARQMGITSSMVGHHYKNVMGKLKKHLVANMNIRSMGDLHNV